MFLTVRLLSAVPRGRPRLGARRTRAPSTITQYEYYSPLTPDGVPKLAGTPPRIVFLHTGFPGNWFSLVFFFKMLLSLRRWPHFRASARSESCSRCSAGLISALPLDPNRAPAAALASFPVPCHGMQCNAMLCSAGRCHAFSCNAMICSA